MSLPRPLRGACSCGRNQYIISPTAESTSSDTNLASILFESSSPSRRALASPLTPLLRVPLPWFQSYTVSFLPDETHHSIRRKFHPPHEPDTQRVFCGFCGTQLSVWTETPAREADFIQVPVGSLLGEDFRELGRLGLLPNEDDAEDGHEIESADKQSTLQRSQEDSSSSAATHRPGETTLTRTSGRTNGLQWFEDLLEGSRLGRTSNVRRGVGISEDGVTRVEWEVSEYYDDGTEGAVHTRTPSSGGAGKRKIDEVGPGDDTEMT